MMLARKRKQDGRQGAAELCARQILEVVPRAMRLLREEMRQEAGVGLSVAQFRVLAFLGRNPGARLSAVAAFVGVADATASVMVERLVRRQLVARAGDPAERRCVMLALTPRGKAVVERAHAHTRERVAAQLGALAGAELAHLERGLAVLDRALNQTEAGSRP
jgi:DNA-binding MarR family transcriptional regulator